MNVNELLMWIGAVGAGGTIQAVLARRIDGLDLIFVICLISVVFSLLTTGASP